MSKRKRTMARNIPKLQNDPQAVDKITQFKQELNEELEHAIESHEFKMVYIGIATPGSVCWRHLSRLEILN